MPAPSSPCIVGRAIHPIGTRRQVVDFSFDALVNEVECLSSRPVLDV